MNNFIKDVNFMVEEVKTLAHLDSISIAEAATYYNLIKSTDFYHLCCRDKGIVIFNIAKNLIEVLSIGENNRLTDVLRAYKEKNSNFLFSYGLEQKHYHCNDNVFDVIKFSSFLIYVDVHTDCNVRNLLASNLTLEEAFSFKNRKISKIA